ncbi:MAG: efflux RND transporter periplasmic adaptor subunit [Flavobacteriaceae bacterium]|nr:efflux RND transporter periplasmic adaptor subunit [Flavobacteriaceae bacterium]
MKNSILLLCILLFIQCGSSDKQTTAEIIASKDLAAIQTKKAEVVKSMNTLKQELESLNEVIGQLDNEQKFLLVTSIETKVAPYEHFVSFQGTLETDKNIVMYPEIPGLLKSINVVEGQRVKKGDVLAVISDSGLVDQLQQLEIQLNLAKTTYERQNRLWEQKIGSEMQFLQAKTQYLSLEKSIAQMKDQVAKTTITAPFDGIVDHLLADVGSSLAPGMTPVVRVINLDEMKVSAQVPEIHLNNIKKAAKVAVNIPVLNKTLPAEINAVGNFINPNNRSFRVEIGLENSSGDLKPNMTVLLNINDYKNEAAILVPSKNILEDQAGAKYLYTLETVAGQDGMYKAIKTFVKTGKSSDNKTEILEGLSAGDQLVEDGIRLVKDQQLVKIIQS